MVTFSLTLDSVFFWSGEFSFPGEAAAKGAIRPAAAPQRKRGRAAFQNRPERKMENISHRIISRAMTNPS